jgi:hypothetical protein
VFRPSAAIVWLTLRRPTSRINMLVAVLSLSSIISRSNCSTLRSVPTGASAMSPQPSSLSRASKWSLVLKSIVPTDIWRKTSTITGILIVEAAGRLALALTPELMPVARSSIETPTVPGARKAARSSCACSSPIGPGRLSALAAQGEAQAHSASRHKSTRVRTCIIAWAPVYTRTAASPLPPNVNVRPLACVVGRGRLVVGRGRL